jgi:hypothetical protein
VHVTSMFARNIIPNLDTLTCILHESLDTTVVLGIHPLVCLISICGKMWAERVRLRSLGFELFVLLTTDDDRRHNMSWMTQHYRLQKPLSHISFNCILHTTA